MRCIGLTGQIASGKSTVAQYFAQKGYKIISADQIAKQLTQQNQPAWHMICEHFGESILQENGELNRKKLRDIILADSEQKQWLEHLLHPIIRAQIKQQICTNPDAHLLVEIPLLKNRKDYPELTHVITILSNEDLKIKRLMQRDHCTYASAKKLLSIQPVETIYRNIADTLIFNNGSRKELRQQLALISQIIS